MFETVLSETVFGPFPTLKSLDAQICEATNLLPFLFGSVVAQCSATPASVAATPPCSATPFQKQLDVRHPWRLKGNRCDRVFFGGGGVHLKSPRILRKSVATRVVRHGVPAHVCNYVRIFPIFRFRFCWFFGGPQMDRDSSSQMGS